VKSKASLILMEQLIMLLVFALAAAACLGIFSAARDIGLSAKRQDEAVLLAQNGAEILKHTAGDLQKTAAMLGGTIRENRLCAPREDGLSLQIQKTDSQIPGLGQANLWVIHGDSDVLFSLTVCWQEVADHET
jgi:hypothetical protein